MRPQPTPVLPAIVATIRSRRVPVEAPDLVDVVVDAIEAGSTEVFYCALPSFAVSVTR